MAKKATITVDADFYEGCIRIVGRRRISRFLNDLAHERVIELVLLEGMVAQGGQRSD